MPHLAPEPAHKGPHRQAAIQAVRLGPAVIPLHRNAARMHHVGLDPAGAQPARQPEAVAARFIGHADAPDRTPRLLRLIAPTVQKRQQCILVDRQLLQRATLDTGQEPRDQPARLAHLNHCDQRAILAKGDG